LAAPADAGAAEELGMPLCEVPSPALGGCHGEGA